MNIIDYIPKHTTQHFYFCQDVLIEIESFIDSVLHETIEACNHIIELYPTLYFIVVRDDKMSFDLTFERIVDCYIANKIVCCGYGTDIPSTTISFLETHTWNMSAFVNKETKKEDDKLIVYICGTTPVYGRILDRIMDEVDLVLTWYSTNMRRVELNMYHVLKNLKNETIKIY